MDRPGAIILVTEECEGEKLVTVLPVTHTPPGNPKLAVEIPLETKKRLERIPKSGNRFSDKMRDKIWNLEHYPIQFDRIML